MPTYGVTAAGFYAKPLSVIESETDEALKGILGESAGVEPDGTIPLDTAAGQLKTLLVDIQSAHWDLVEASVANTDPNKATGRGLDNIGQLTGAQRAGSSYSSVPIICTGTLFTLLPVGRVVTVEGTGSRFASTEEATLITALTRTNSSPYSLGIIRHSAGRIYIVITAGVTGGSGSAPTTTDEDITDGSVHWRYLGEGTAYAEVNFQAEEVGEIGGLAYEVNQISTPISGWRNAVNVEDVTIGSTQESDPAFRIRRDAETGAIGNSVVDAIRANILKVNEDSVDPDHLQPVACKVFYNNTDFADGNGLPPHSVEILVQGGTDADIAQAVWDSVAGGTATVGNQTSTVTDDEGNEQTVYWSRPEEVPIYVTAVGRYNAASWPDGSELVVAEAILSALLTYTENYEIGVDVRISPLMAAMLRGPSATDDEGAAVVPADDDASPVTGLLEISEIYIGLSASPSQTTQISISNRQIASFDSTRCTITAATEEP